MSKKARDFIFYIFIIIFIVLTVGVSLYATGYKFNLRWPLRLNALLVKTGMLVVDTEPTGATVYLNDEPQSETSLNIWSKKYAATPAKIKNILPGDYDLRLEKTGYWPWQKKITINPGQTAFAENINLFRNDLPIFIATSTSRQLLLSPSRQYLYLPTERKIIDLSAEQVRLLPTVATNGLWLMSSDRLSAAGGLYDPQNEKSDANYQSIIGQAATNWFYEEATGRLYYQTNNSLSRLEADGRTTTVLLPDGHYLAYEPRGDHLYVVMSEQNKITLRDYNLKTGQATGQIVLPSVGTYRFVYDHRPRLSLYDEQNKTLYLINPSNITDSPETIKHILSWVWSNDSQLFYNNNWEIYYYDLSKNESTLLTRVGEAITGLMLNPNREYLAFSENSNLNVLDLKTGLTTVMFTADKINGTVLDAKNNILYFNASIGHNEGIYKLNLQ